MTNRPHMTYTESTLDPTPEFINECQLHTMFLRFRHLTPRQAIAEFRGEPYPEIYTDWLVPERANPWQIVNNCRARVDSTHKMG